MTKVSHPRDAPAGFPLIRDVGLSGLLVSFSNTLSDAANRAALAFRTAIEAQDIPGVIETSTSLISTFVSYDPLMLPREVLRERLADMLGQQQWSEVILPPGRRLWRIPAAFGGCDGPQLAETASLVGLSVEQAISEITCQPVRVMTIGFAPGMPYMGTLPDRWNLPRQERLSAQVPAGAVVTAICQLNIFTNATPTGWRHIGQTAFRNFRKEDPSPFALAPGDEVQFVPITSEQLADLREAGSADNGGAVFEAIS